MVMCDGLVVLRPAFTQLHTVQCIVGWTDFLEEKNSTLVMLCQLALGPQFQNLTV